MASSEARVAANRRNAQRSSGPRTEAGKQASRGNALKHGLSGDGVVLTVGDGAAVDALEEELATELGPVGAIGDDLVRRAAVLLVRLRRCADHDHAATAHRVRHAAADFDDDRADEVAIQAGRLAAEPGDAVRRLRRTPEGIDWSIGAWRAIRFEAEGKGPTGKPGESLADRVGTLLGLRPWDEREPEISEWQGWCRDLDAGAGAGTRGRVVARVDREIAALRALRRELAEIAAADRVESPARALFDPTPAGHRARKYEAATERGLFRVLREIRQARAEAAPAPPKPASVAPPVPTPAPAPPTLTVAAIEPAPRPTLPAMSWPAWPDFDDDCDVPLSIGRTTTFPAQTNPFPGAKTNPTHRRPRLG